MPNFTINKAKVSLYNKSMTLDDYQKRSRKTAVYPDLGKNIIYPTLGFVGEAGELADKVKKIFRDDSGKIKPEVKEAIIIEIGDVLWYMAQLCTELNIKMSRVADENLVKLRSRLKRNTLHGSGDER